MINVLSLYESSLSESSSAMASSKACRSQNIETTVGKMMSFQNKDSGLLCVKTKVDVNVYGSIKCLCSCAYIYFVVSVCVGITITSSSKCSHKSKTFHL